MPPVLTKSEQFYVVKDILRSKAFLRSFALDSGNMVSNDGDNAKEKITGNTAHVAVDEGESYHSWGDPPRGDHSRDDSVEYVGNIRKR